MSLKRYLVLFVLTFAATSEFWYLFVSMTDEAVATLGAERWVGGELPFRDWDSRMPPGSYALTALWCSLFGWAAPAPRMLASFVWALTGVGVHCSAERLLAGRLRYLPWLLWTTGGVVEFPILNYHWMAACAMSWVLFGALLWFGERNPKGAAIMGLASALAGWVLQSEGLAALLTVAVLSIRFRSLPPRAYWMTLLPTALVLFFPAWRFFPQFVDQALRLSSHLSFNHNPYSWSNMAIFLDHYRGLSPSDGWVAFLAGLSHCWLNLVRYGAFPLVLIGMLWLCERRGQPVHKALAWALLAWTLALSNRLNVLYLSFLGPGWVLLFVTLLRFLPRAGTLAALLALIELCGWGFRAAFRQQAYRYPIQTRRGTYYTLSPNEAALHAGLGAWLQPLQPGTPVLAFPYFSEVYTLYRLRNPLRQDVLVPLLQKPEQFELARRRLDELKVQYILYVGPEVSAIAEETGFEPQQIEQAWEIERQRMTRGFLLIHGTPQAGLYRRP